MNITKYFSGLRYRDAARELLGMKNKRGLIADI